MGDLLTGRIVQVEYRELVTGPGYNNTTIGAFAVVKEGELPERTLSELEGWVQFQFGARQKLREDTNKLASEGYRLREEKRKLEREIAARRAELDLLRGPSARLRLFQGWFARRFARLAPPTWRADVGDLDDVPF